MPCFSIYTLVIKGLFSELFPQIIISCNTKVKKGFDNVFSLARLSEVEWPSPGHSRTKFRQKDVELYNMNLSDGNTQ